MPVMRSAVVLIPAYRPDEALVSLTRKLSGQVKVLVVDDGSGEEYREIFERLPEDVDLVRHPTNQGKGSALRTGMAYLLEHMPDARGIVTADADGQHLAEDILRVADHLEGRDRAMVIGGRRFEGKVPFPNRMGNLITGWVYTSATRVRVRDTQTGLRGFTMDLLPELLRLPGDRYEYEINVLLWAASNQVEMEEVAIHTVYREGNSSSHYRILRDSLLIYSRIVRFVMSSAAAFLVDFTALFLLRARLWHLGEARALLVSVVGARILSSTFNYTVNRKLVFRSREAPSRSALRFLLLAVSLLMCNYLLMHLFSLVLRLPLVTAKLTVEGILFLASYALQKRLVFRAGENFPRDGGGVRAAEEPEQTGK